jgi:hypothetical protein
MNTHFNNFNWESYININKDLKNITNKEEAWKHWISNGKNEKRPLCLYNNTFIHNGRLGNLFFINMVFHFLSLKLNINCFYKYKKKFDKLGIYFHNGTNKFEDSILLTDSNFFDLINNSSLSKNNIYINNENWFQTKEFAYYLKEYFNTPYLKYRIIEKNIFKHRYKNNNDLFIHVRLGDVENRNENLLSYFDNTISKLNFNQGFISSDDIDNSLCKFLISKYKLTKIDYDEIKTIMFATTCNNLLLSGGTFSWLIGFLSFYSKNIYYPNLKNCWYGNIFQFPFWKSVDLN